MIFVAGTVPAGRDIMNENRYHIFKEGGKVDEVQTWDDAVEVARSYEPAIIQDCSGRLGRTRRRTWAVAAMYDAPVYMGGQPAL